MAGKSRLRPVSILEQISSFRYTDEMWIILTLIKLLIIVSDKKKKEKKPTKSYRMK